MSKKKILIYAWPLIVLLGIPLTLCIFGYIYYLLFLPQDTNLIAFWGWPSVYADFFFRLENPYTYLIYPVLIWSFICWFKNPCWRNLLWTIFAGWVLCGFPGWILMYFSLVFMSNR